MKTGLGARLNLSGTLEWRDKDGNVLKVVEMRGSVPLEQLGLTVEQAQELIDKEQTDGNHDRQ